MKLVFIILTLTLLCKNINSQKFKPPSGSNFPGGFDFPDGPFGSDGSDDCEEKSNDDETNADCCVKKPQPSWCPKLSVSSIKNQLSRLNKSSKVRSFVKKEVSQFRSKNNKPSSFGPSDGKAQSHALTHSNFWWPWFCDWNFSCCSWCYLMWIWPNRFHNWWQYHDCIWHMCW